MKKFVKPLIIAASVACIGGVGAVSFAAWQNANHAAVDTTGATGSISLLGFASNTATGFTGLMPWDQSGASVTLSDSVYKSVALPAIVSESKTYKITASSDETLDGTVYIKLATTAPTETITSVSDLTTGGWVALTSTAEEVVASATGDTTYTAYFVLASTDTADMGQSFNVTISISEVV